MSAIRCVAWCRCPSQRCDRPGNPLSGSNSLRFKDRCFLSQDLLVRLCSEFVLFVAPPLLQDECNMGMVFDGQVNRIPFLFACDAYLEIETMVLPAAAAP